VCGVFIGETLAGNHLSGIAVITVMISDAPQIISVSYGCQTLLRGGGR
jgi:hypothetical protein